MAKVEIIDINLGSTVHDIIANSNGELSKKTKQAIAIVVEDQRLAEEEKRKQQDQRLSKSRAVDAKVAAVFNLLLTESKQQRPVKATKLLAAAMPEITNLISLVNRLRTYLRSNDDQYRLVSQKLGGAQHYSLAIFNPVEDPQSEQPLQ